MVKRKQKKQSSLSRVLASANDRAKVVRRFFTMLTPTEIGRSVSQLNNHRHFRKIVNLKEQSPSEFYVKRSPNVNLAKKYCLVPWHSFKCQRRVDTCRRSKNSNFGTDSNVRYQCSSI